MTLAEIVEAFGEQAEDIEVQIEGFRGTLDILEALKPSLGAAIETLRIHASDLQVILASREGKES